MHELFVSKTRTSEVRASEGFCFLDAIQTRLGSNQMTNLQLSSAFAGKFEGGADKKAAKIGNAV